MDVVVLEGQSRHRHHGDAGVAGTLLTTGPE
jgi:hypothetical protein